MLQRQLMGWERRGLEAIGREFGVKRSVVKGWANQGAPIHRQGHIYICRDTQKLKEWLALR